MNAKIISIMGAKDGIGASTFCRELASHLKRQGSVLLLDCDVFHPGDLQLITEEKREWREISDLSKLNGVSDPEFVSGFLKGPDGISTLRLVPMNRAQPALPPPEPFHHLQGLTPYYDWIVADLGSHWHPLGADLLSNTTLLLFILGPKPTLLKELKRKTDELAASFFPFQRAGWIANHWGEDSFLRIEDVDHYLKIPCFGESAGDLLYKLNPFSPPNGDFGAFNPGALLWNGAKPIEKKEVTAPKIVEHNCPVFILEKVKERMEIKGLKAEKNEEGLRDKIQKIILEVMQEAGDQIPENTDRPLLIEDLLDELLGLGPLEKLLTSSYGEILVNGCAPIYVEEEGRLKKTPLQFATLDSLNKAIERILHHTGRRVDESSPMVDSRLKDGSRVNIIIPPLALNGPVVSIRRFSRKRLSPEDWVRIGSVTEEMLQFLKEGVLHKMNILVSGGTGSGKTTLLNLLSSFIPKEERIITIEDAAELKLNQPHVVRLESRPANIEGKGMIAIRDLVKNSLRMRPDRIVVGECRGAEALDMLQAMNTGHDGSLTTLHANSPRDALSRLETLVMFAGMDLPSKAIREQIASAIDIIVQIARGADGSRKIVSIAKLSGMEGDVFTLEDVI